MDGRRILVVLLGVVSCSPNSPELEVIIRSGDNVTLYCDCKVDRGVYIVWYRNCSDRNHSSLVLHVNSYTWENRIPNFKFQKNFSSDSYDLVILNATISDEGLYYCGTETSNVEKTKDKNIIYKNIYTYGNITQRVRVYSSEPDSVFNETQQDCSLCWKLLYFLCPAVSVVSIFLALVLAHLVCPKIAREAQDAERSQYSVRQTHEAQDEDVCYAALEIRSASQKLKRKRTTQSSDFSVYSDINTPHV
ncbi:uncharacterized protein [Nothobranchius furzeri]|uniref:LOC107374342-like protein n=3 Tax=Nothobranchius furzeri TaxID=105023 RepID=A0A9D3BN00_NOTFU|nr:putative LOC107374342-like protein [Nothobranchius furzeri]